MSIFPIFSSPALARILALLLLHPERKFYQSQIVSHTGLALMLVQRALSRLMEADLIEKTTQGRMVFYQAKTTHPGFTDLKSLFAKTIGIADVFKDVLEPLSQSIKYAFIFGSLAKGEEKAESDIDLMIIGSITLMEASGPLMDAGEVLRREVNPVIYSVEEFKTKQTANNHFVKQVTGSPKLWIYGDAKEFDHLFQR